MWFTKAEMAQTNVQSCLLVGWVYLCKFLFINMWGQRLVYRDGNNPYSSLKQHSHGHLWKSLLGFLPSFHYLIKQDSITAYCMICLKLEKDLKANHPMWYLIKADTPSRKAFSKSRPAEHVHAADQRVERGYNIKRNWECDTLCFWRQWSHAARFHLNWWVTDLKTLKSLNCNGFFVE